MEKISKKGALKLCKALVKQSRVLAEDQLRLVEEKDRLNTLLEKALKKNLKLKKKVKKNKTFYTARKKDE